MDKRKCQYFDWESSHWLSNFTFFSFLHRYPSGQQGLKSLGLWPCSNCNPVVQEKSPMHQPFLCIFDLIVATFSAKAKAQHPFLWNLIFAHFTDLRFGWRWSSKNTKTNSSLVTKVSNYFTLLQCRLFLPFVFPPLENVSTNPLPLISKNIVFFRNCSVWKAQQFRFCMASYFLTMSVSGWPSRAC